VLLLVHRSGRGGWRAVKARRLSALKGLGVVASSRVLTNVSDCPAKKGFGCTDRQLMKELMQLAFERALRRCRMRRAVGFWQLQAALREVKTTMLSDELEVAVDMDESALLLVCQCGRQKIGDWAAVEVGAGLGEVAHHLRRQADGLVVRCEDLSSLAERRLGGGDVGALRFGQQLEQNGSREDELVVRSFVEQCGELRADFRDPPPRPGGGVHQPTHGQAKGSSRVSMLSTMSWAVGPSEESWDSNAR
jgi:hypothetical protein